MKLRWVFLFGGGIALLTAAVGVGAALLFDDSEPWVLIVTLLSAMLLITAPAIAGIWVANFTFDLESTDGRGVFRRLVLITTAIQLLGIVGLVFVAIAVPSATAFLVGVTALSAALLLVGLRIGIRLHRRMANGSRDGKAWSPWSPTLIRSKVMRVVVVFLIASVIGVGGLIGLRFIVTDPGEASSLAVVMYGFSFGFISASVACIVVAWPLVKDLRHALGRDYATQKAIGRVVLRNKDDELPEGGQQKATSYAAIMSVYLPFQIAQITLLFAGLWLQQLWNLIDESSTAYSSLTLGLVISYPILLAAALPFIIRQARNAKRYAVEHADLVSTNPAEPGKGPDSLAS
ncbi:hypothetical protein [Arthrobacter sp. H14]|uniref:hypothetical protein n=1 Tax=Arthrobacter sp. H14 TaxID=1312959 RepID=UPI00047EA371|nr:hypothetical protein [Arthrobacter sp. H14]